MKHMLIAVLVVLGVIAVAPRGGAADSVESAQRMSYDDDDDEEEWKCTCSVTCDDEKFTITEKVCADDEDLKEAMQEAVDSCYRDADPRCEDEPACKCKCVATNRAC
jgi:hypothetical protein